VGGQDGGGYIVDGLSKGFIDPIHERNVNRARAGDVN